MSVVDHLDLCSPEKDCSGHEIVTCQMQMASQIKELTCQKYIGQTSQVSRFCRETYDFQLNLRVSRYAMKISRFLENLTFFKENLPFFSMPKN